MKAAGQMKRNSHKGNGSIKIVPIRHEYPAGSYGWRLQRGLLTLSDYGKTGRNREHICTACGESFQSSSGNEELCSSCLEL